MSVCVVRDCKPNEFYSAKEFQDQTVKSIAKIIGSENSPISIKSPFFQILLEPNSKPLDEYPELVVENRTGKYPPPSWHLYIKTEGEMPELTLFFSVKTQLDTVFPKMGVGFYNNELERVKVSDVLSRCISTFGYECSEQCLIMDGATLDPKLMAKEFLMEAKTKEIEFNCVLMDSAKKKVNHRLYASNEIITSEEAYISDLSELIDYWEPAIRVAKLFDQQQLKNLFRDIPLIRNSHNVFLSSLKSEINFSTEFGCKFLNFVQFFKLSATFVSQFKSIDELIKEKSKTRSFENKFKEIENNLPAGNGRDFLNYYITPVQRYPRYLILMRELDKVTPLFHPDKPYIALAMEAIENVNKEIDFSSYRMKKLEIMDNLQNYFGNSITINEPGREVIKTTKIRIVKPKSAPGVIILLSDILIIASVASKKSYQMLINVQNQNFRFANCRPTPESLMIIFEEKEYVIQFNDYEEKLAWMSEYVKIRKNYFNSISTPNPYVIWSDIEVGESIPAIMNHDGCSINGSALFFGGVNVSLSNINTLIRYNFNANTWSTINTPLQSRDSHTMTALDGIAYICFGHSKKDYFNDCYTFDEYQGTWSPLKLKGDTPIGRIGHTCVIYDKKLVFFGGKTKEGELLNDVCFIDTQTNTFKQLKDLENSPSPRMYHSAAIVGSKMIIIGGRSEKTICGDIFTFDLKKLEWSKAPIEIQSRMYHKLISYKNLLIIIGGTGDKDELDVLDVNTWKFINIEQYGNIPFGISRFACVQIDQRHVLIFGGTDSSTRTPISSTYLLDLSHLSVQKVKRTKRSKYSTDSKLIHEFKKEDARHTNKKDETGHHQVKETIKEEIPTQPVKEVKEEINKQPIKEDKEEIPTQPVKEVKEEVNKQPIKEVEEEIPTQPVKEVKEVKEDKEEEIPVQPVKEVKEEIPTQPVKEIKEEVNKQPVNEEAHKQEEIKSETHEEQKIQQPANEQMTLFKKIFSRKAKTIQPQKEEPKKLPEQKKQKPQTVIKSTQPSTEPESKTVYELLSKGPSLIGHKFNENEVYNMLNIDISNFTQMAKAATRIKAHRLWQTIIENQNLEEKLNKLEQIISGKKELPPNTKLLLKIYDDSTKTTKIKHISSNDDAFTIQQIVSKQINRDALLQINIDQTKTVKLTNESLKIAHENILLEKIHAIILVAL